MDRRDRPLVPLVRKPGRRAWVNPEPTGMHNSTSTIHREHNGRAIVSSLDLLVGYHQETHKLGTPDIFYLMGNIRAVMGGVVGTQAASVLP